jgi:hypothetical protein
VLPTTGDATTDARILPIYSQYCCCCRYVFLTRFCIFQVASRASTTARYIILSDEETESILQSASDCAEGECSIDDVSELLYELKAQEKEMQNRLDKIMNMISHLQHINAKEERKTDEVRSFVKDMLRVFSSDKPIVFPTGYAGDVGGGPTTAYDALPPKKWVPADKKK